MTVDAGMDRLGFMAAQYRASPRAPGRVAVGSASAAAERARCYRAEPPDPPLERAAGQTHLKRELLVPLKLYPADRDPVDRHVDLAPRAVSEPLVAMLPDVAGAHRCQHLLVDCDGACRIRVGAPELAELFDVGGVRPALRALESGRKPPHVRIGRAPRDSGGRLGAAGPAGAGPRAPWR